MTDKNKCFVGFDTSNYTTSIAVCDIDGNVVANFKAPLSVSQGERGLRQSDAVFAHIKNLPMLSDKLAEVLREYEPLAVGLPGMVLAILINILSLISSSTAVISSELHSV